MKVFWSWQSDTPGKIGRFLIRDALREAIDQLKQAPDIDEPVREALDLDHDTKDVTGSPDLANTIFSKIDESEIVVADVTAVGAVLAATGAGKKLINSNVAIELGYALRARTDKNVLLVFNKHYGTFEDLPFDLRHKGGAIFFSLRPEAERKEIDEQRKQLKDWFVLALKPFLVQKVTQVMTPSEEIPSTFNRGAYFKVAEVLTPTGHKFAHPEPSLCYLRLIPKSRVAPSIELAALNDVVQLAPLLTQGDFASNHGLNRHGAITWTLTGSTVAASTQLFQNGEIWCLGVSLIRTEGDGRPQHVKLPFIPVFPLEQTYYDKVWQIIDFATKHLALERPWDMEVGLAGISGIRLNVASGQLGPTHKTEIVYRLSVKDGKEYLDMFLLAFFSQVFDSVGQRRPPNLHGFPPNRPSV